MVSLYQPLCHCHQDRVPFVVPDRVPWRMMYNTLNSKFTSEVGTQHNLDQYNQHFLAQKVFDKPDFNEDFSNMMVSWAQFNKVRMCLYLLAQVTLTHKSYGAFQHYRRFSQVDRLPSGSGLRE